MLIFQMLLVYLKNGRRQSVSFAFVADIPTGIKNNSVKRKKYESELVFQRRAS